MFPAMLANSLGSIHVPQGLRHLEENQHTTPSSSSASLSNVALQISPFRSTVQENYVKMSQRMKQICPARVEDGCFFVFFTDLCVFFHHTDTSYIILVQTIGL